MRILFLRDMSLTSLFDDADSQTTRGHTRRVLRPLHLPLHAPIQYAGAQTAQPNLSAGGNNPLTNMTVMKQAPWQLWSLPTCPAAAWPPGENAPINLVE